MVVAPLVLSSTKLTIVTRAVKVSYNNAPTTLIAILTECNLIHDTLSKIQELVYWMKADLSSTLKAEKLMREIFDGAFTKCRMTLAALNLELEKLVDPKKGMKPMEIEFQAKPRLVWKEEIMKQLLGQMRGLLLSMQCLLCLLESQAQREDIAKLMKQNLETLRNIFGDQSSFQSTDIAYETNPPYPVQLSKPSAYQREESAATKEMLAARLRLSEQKAALSLLEMDLKDEKVTRLEHEISVKNETLGRLGHDILLKDGPPLSKGECINDLEEKITQSEIVSTKKQADERLSKFEFDDEFLFFSRKSKKAKKVKNATFHNKITSKSTPIPILIRDELFVDSFQEDNQASLPKSPVIETKKILDTYKPTIQDTPTSSDVVGVLFKSCADLFWLMTKELCRLDLIEQKEKLVVRDTFEKFYFWGAGFQAEQGGLDAILVSSTNLKDQILSLLLKIAKILDTGDLPNRNWI